MTTYRTKLKIDCWKGVYECDILTLDRDITLRFEHRLMSGLEMRMNSMSQLDKSVSLEYNTQFDYRRDEIRFALDITTQNESADFDSIYQDAFENLSDFAIDVPTDSDVYTFSILEATSSELRQDEDEDKSFQPNVSLEVKVYDNNEHVDATKLDKNSQYLIERKISQMIKLISQRVESEFKLANMSHQIRFFYTNIKIEAKIDFVIEHDNNIVEEFLYRELNQLEARNESVTIDGKVYTLNIVWFERSR